MSAASARSDELRGFAADRNARLRAAATRIRELAPTFADRLTGEDLQTGERWDRGQVLSHAVELLPYWAEQARHVVEGGGDGLAFGRVKTTPSRLARIEDGRYAEPTELLERMDAEVAAVASYLDGLTPDALALTGTHQTLGEMTVAEIVDEFLVEHLEQHATQLAG